MANIEAIKEYVLQYIEEHRGVYFNMAHQIWEKPELSMEEHFASKLLADFLEAQGFALERGAAGMPTAFVATWGEGKPVIGFSMEYDALPGLSQKAQCQLEPVRSGAPGQGCGHNLIGVGGAMAAVAFKNAAEKFGLPCTIKVFGTPAEELCIGKPVMGNAGYFRDLDCVIDWHPWFLTTAQFKTCPAYFSVKYHYHGRTSHGNSPWHGRSALDSAVLQAHAIEMLREHILPGPSTLAANTINFTFSDTGPEFPSVVPDRATLWCIGRFETAEQLSDALARIDNTARGAAMATGTTVDIEYLAASHEQLPNEPLQRAMQNNLDVLGDVEYTEEEKEFVMQMQQQAGQEPYWKDGPEPFGFTYACVTDASEYSWEAPYAQLMIKLGPGPGWHNWMVTACSGTEHGEKAMRKGAEILATTAVDLASDPELIAACKAEWAARRGGRDYHSLLPEGTPIPLDISKETMAKYR